MLILARITRAGVTAIIVAGLLVIVVTAVALAHHAPSGQAYPPECCRGSDVGGDCAPISETELQARPDGGYLIKASGEVFMPPGTPVKYPLRNFRWSTDGQFHRCLSNPQDVKSYTYCLFVVPPGA